MSSCEENEKSPEKIFPDKYKEANLENQIEVMLDDIMDVENENEDLRFSDDDSFINSELVNEKEEMPNFKTDGASSLFSLALNGSTYSEEPERIYDNGKYQRKNKKFQTVSFNQKESLGLQQNINNKNIFKAPHNGNFNNFQNNNNNCYPPLNNNNNSNSPFHLFHNNNNNNNNLINNNNFYNGTNQANLINLQTNQLQNSFLNTNNVNNISSCSNSQIFNNTNSLNNSEIFNQFQRNIKRKNTIDIANSNFNFINRIKASINMNVNTNCSNGSHNSSLINLNATNPQNLYCSFNPKINAKVRKSLNPNNQNCINLICNINNNNIIEPIIQQQNNNNLNNNISNLNMNNLNNLNAINNINNLNNMNNINTLNNMNTLNTINSINNINNMNNLNSINNINNMNNLNNMNNNNMNNLNNMNNISKINSMNNLNNMANQIYSNNNINNINSNKINKESYLFSSPQRLKRKGHLLTNNMAQNINASNVNSELIKEKRSSTTIYQKGTNMQLEFLIYELNNALRKIEKIDYYMYNKIQGNFISIIKTHNGSRIFQNYLKNTHSDIIHQIFIEINLHLPDLISDSYANYFCKRFFCYLNQKDRIDFLISIQSSLVKLSMDKIGTYPIQSIIEQVGSKVEKKIIINSLQNSIAELCINTYGCHILEKIISYFEEEFTSFIYDYISNNFIPLANNINGICVVKKILTLTHKKELHEKLKKMSLENACSLIQHCYGNYVIQVIVENWDLSEIIEIIEQFKGKFVYLSMQKYSSNVVERCIEKSSQIFNDYIEEICQSDRIAEIMKNNFGNYVIQKALKLSSGKNRLLLSDYVNKNIYKLNDKKLITKWKSIVAPYLDNNNNNDANNNNNNNCVFDDKNNNNNINNINCIINPSDVGISDNV